MLAVESIENKSKIWGGNTPTKPALLNKKLIIQNGIVIAKIKNNIFTYQYENLSNLIYEHIKNNPINLKMYTTNSCLLNDETPITYELRNSNIDSPQVILKLFISNFLYFANTIIPVPNKNITVQFAPEVVITDKAIKKYSKFSALTDILELNII